MDMIENWVQYRVIGHHWLNFTNELIAIKDIDTPPENIHPKIWQAQKDAMQSKIDEFELQLFEFEKNHPALY